MIGKPCFVCSGLIIEGFPILFMRSSSIVTSYLRSSNILNYSSSKFINILLRTQHLDLLFELEILQQERYSSRKAARYSVVRIGGSRNDVLDNHSNFFNQPVNNMEQKKNKSFSNDTSFTNNSIDSSANMSFNQPINNQSPSNDDSSSNKFVVSFNSINIHEIIIDVQNEMNFINIFIILIIIQIDFLAQFNFSKRKGL